MYSKCIYVVYCVELPVYIHLLFCSKYVCMTTQVQLMKNKTFVTKEASFKNWMQTSVPFKCILASRMCQSQVMSEFNKKQTIYAPFKQEICIFSRK